MTNVYYAGKKNDVVLTPEKLYRDLDNIFHFDFDPTPVDPGFDGLEVEWGKSNYINPPYSNVPRFIKKSLAEKKPSVFLIPIRSRKKYWKEEVFPNANAIWFLDRIVFQGYKTPFPIPVGLVFFNFSPSKINKILLDPNRTQIGDSKVAIFQPIKRPEERCTLDEGKCQETVERVGDVIVYFDCHLHYAMTLDQAGSEKNPHTGKSFSKKIISQISNLQK